jgi:hypothetical protein
VGSNYRGATAVTRRLSGASNGRVTSERRIGKDLEGGTHGLITRTIPPFVWRE